MLLLGKTVKEDSVFFNKKLVCRTTHKNRYLKITLIILHAMMSYGAILQGNLADRNEVLKIQKKIIRIMAGVKKVAVL